MRKWKILFHPVLLIVLAQIAWFSLLGLWIYWYVSNNIIFTKVENTLQFRIFSPNKYIVIFVLGLILLAGILFVMYFIYINHNRQKNLNKLYDNFISNVTHELKSPLAAIQLYLETMKKQEVPRPREREFLDFMIRDANRLTSLINSILNIPRLEQKKIAYDFRVYSIQPLIQTYIEEARDQFILPQQSIVLSGSVNCKCVVDRNALQIVFNNLIDNANKYSPDSVKLRIVLSCSNKNLIIQFHDQGMGISKNNLKRVFNKFQRIYHNDMPSVKGTGLGLYWVKEIIKYHGGKVTVHSEGINKGTTFRIELPIYQTSKKRYVNYLLKIAKRKETIEGPDV